MIKLYDTGTYYINGKIIPDTPENLRLGLPDKKSAKAETIAYKILESHNTSKDMEKLKLKFDALASHDITYVGIIQTARASGLSNFPVPYVLTNCHNSLCAVGGTINEDDHLFGLSCARRYGGIYVPAHQAVIHQYMREMLSGCGKMILGSDSHTRYGALGTLAIGEGGPELVKQILNKTYDVNMPEIIGVCLKGAPAPYVGPQDVALSIIGAVFENGYVKNKIMEFIGDGIKNLSADFRNGVDVMTTETACLSSVWQTDEETENWYITHGREDDYKTLSPGKTAYYDGMIEVDLSKIKPMIAMPFHPSNTYTIAELKANLKDIIAETERLGLNQLESGSVKFSLQNNIRGNGLYVEQGVIAGCAGGTYENLCAAGSILKNHSIGSGEFALSVYPASQPVFLRLMETGIVPDIMLSGATVRSAFCGPCFGAGDVPANNCLSIRHSTRNFPNREGSKINDGQIASVALMDARSIAATAISGGKLTGADEIALDVNIPKYFFHSEVYKNRCYDGFGKPDPSVSLRLGPNIADWPKMSPLTENLLLKVATVIHDPVTTTDELIPSGETSSYRSNPLGLAEFTLSRKDPLYVGRAKEIKKAEDARLSGKSVEEAYPPLGDILSVLNKNNLKAENTGLGSVIYAVKPGDGSAREQAASCQKVLGGWANIASDYATKRYRSNLINWGMLPFILEGAPDFVTGDYIYIPGIKKAIETKAKDVPAYIVNKTGVKNLSLKLGDMTDDEREIILSGCLINFYNK